MMFMPSHASDPRRIARRLRKLIDHLQMSDAEFSNATGVTQGYLSRLLSGERGASGDAPTLFLATRDRLDLDGHYWSAREDVAPASCLPSGPLEEGRRMASKQPDMRASLAKLAAERDDPPEVVKQLLLTQAPANADPVWWVRRYLDLVDAHKA